MKRFIFGIIGWILRRFSKKEIVHLGDWRRLKIHAGFTTRHFPLVLHNTEDLSESSNQSKFKKLLSESPVLLSHQVSLGSKFVYVDQVHGDRIAVLDDVAPFANDGFYRFSGTDGVLTNLPGLTLLVMTADCLSIFFSAGKGDNHWVGLVHAGWRGTQKEIAKKAFRTIQERSACPSSEIRVIFGPCIGKNQYEVGEDFVRYFPHTVREKRGKLFFDLAGENKGPLVEAGAKLENILDLEICTVSENDDFYSFRKEKESAGRLISFIKKF